MGEDKDLNRKKTLMVTKADMQTASCYECSESQHAALGIREKYTTVYYKYKYLQKNVYLNMLQITKFDHAPGGHWSAFIKNQFKFLFDKVGKITTIHEKNAAWLAGLLPGWQVTGFCFTA